MRVTPAEVLAVLAIGAMLLVVASRGNKGRQKDPVRLYSPAQRRIIVERAGSQCEHTSVFGRRCPVRDGLAADHIWPHTLGGWTSLGNAQALCVSHNSSKGGRPPTKRYMRRLVRNRKRYFPIDQDPRVERFPKGVGQR